MSTNFGVASGGINDSYFLHYSFPFLQKDEDLDNPANPEVYQTETDPVISLEDSYESGSLQSLIYKNISVITEETQAQCIELLTLIIEDFGKLIALAKVENDTYLKNSGLLANNPVLKMKYKKIKSSDKNSFLKLDARYIEAYDLIRVKEARIDRALAIKAYEKRLLSHIIQGNSVASGRYRVEWRLSEIKEGLDKRADNQRFTHSPPRAQVPPPQFDSTPTNTTNIDLRQMRKLEYMLLSLKESATVLNHAHSDVVLPPIKDKNHKDVTLYNLAQASHAVELESLNRIQQTLQELPVIELKDFKTIEEREYASIRANLMDQIPEIRALIASRLALFLIPVLKDKPSLIDNPDAPVDILTFIESAKDTGKEHFLTPFSKELCEIQAFLNDIVSFREHLLLENDFEGFIIDGADRRKRYDYAASKYQDLLHQKIEITEKHSARIKKIDELISTWISYLNSLDTSLDTISQRKNELETILKVRKKTWLVNSDEEKKPKESNSSTAQMVVGYISSFFATGTPSKSNTNKQQEDDFVLIKSLGHKKEKKNKVEQGDNEKEPAQRTIPEYLITQTNENTSNQDNDASSTQANNTNLDPNNTSVESNTQTNEIANPTNEPGSNVNVNSNPNPNSTSSLTPTIENTPNVANDASSTLSSVPASTPKPSASPAPAAAPVVASQASNPTPASNPNTNQNTQPQQQKNKNTNNTNQSNSPKSTSPTSSQIIPPSNLPGSNSAKPNAPNNNNTTQVNFAPPLNNQTPQNWVPNKTKGNI